MVLVGWERNLYLWVCHSLIIIDSVFGGTVVLHQEVTLFLFASCLIDEDESVLELIGPSVGLELRRSGGRES